MLRYGQFVALNRDIAAKKDLENRQIEYNRFASEALGRFGAATIHDLTDEDYELFLEEMKRYRQARLVSETKGK